MIKFCRSCGKELDSTSNTFCADCGNRAVKADAFCRYCGHTTTSEDLVCPTCGSALKPNTGKARIIAGQTTRLMKAGKIINLTMVVIGIAAYVVFVMPPKVTKPIKAATSDAVLVSTGYTATPLYSISAVPSKLPMSNPIAQIENFDIADHLIDIVAFEPNDVRPLTIYSTYSTNKSGAGTANFQDITADCMSRGSYFSDIRRLFTRDWLRRDVAWRIDRGRSGGSSRLLFTGASASPERTLLVRAALVAGLLGFTMLVFWLDRAGLYDAVDGEISFSDIVYFTLVTVTTVGYGDIVPVSDRARLIDALLVTPVRIFVWFIFLGTAYEFVIRRVIEDLRMNAIQRRLESHVIVCGFGFSGRVAARELVAKGQSKERIVVIDTRADRLEAAAEAGYIGLRGDATREAALREARPACLLGTGQVWPWLSPVTQGRGRCGII